MSEDTDKAPRPPWRPTKYNEETIPKTIEYMTGGYQDHGHIIPSIVGLATSVFCVSQKTIYNWAEKEENEDFLHILDVLKDIQQQTLISGGLSGGFNATITKLVLAKHGYADRVETDQVIKDERFDYNDLTTAEEASRVYSDRMKSKK